MINVVNAEKFVKSKVALCMVLLIAVGILLKDRNNLTDQIKQDKIDSKIKDSTYTVEIHIRDSTIYACQQQQKITADNATKSAQMQAQEYKSLWLEYVNMKTEAKQKNVIQ